jgi:hypothetical protein
MAPPSKLAIATSSLQRLIKEEASYHKEAVQQEARIKKIEADESDENKEYILKQEVTKVAVLLSIAKKLTIYSAKRLEGNTSTISGLEAADFRSLATLGRAIGELYSHIAFVLSSIQVLIPHIGGKQD